MRTPIKRPRGKGHSGFEKRAHSAHAKLRVPAERGFAVLKRFPLLDRLCISASRATALVQAIFAIIHKRPSLVKTQTEKAHCYATSQQSHLTLAFVRITRARIQCQSSLPSLWASLIFACVGDRGRFNFLRQSMQRLAMGTSG